MRFLVADIKRGFTEPRFFLAVVLGLGCGLVSGLVIYSRGTVEASGFFIQSPSLVLPFIMPLLCALTYSNMQMQEQDTGFDYFMALRLKQKTWVFRRFLVNGIVSGVTAVVPGLGLLVVSLWLGTGACTLEVYQVLALNVAFGFAFGSLAYGLGFVNEQAYIPLVAPQVLYWFLVYALPILELDVYFPPLAFAPWILPGVASYPHIGLLLGTITGVSVVLCCVGAVKKAVRP